MSLGKLFRIRATCSRARRSKRYIASCEGESLEGRTLLSAGSVPAMFQVDENPTSSTFGCYTPNVVRRFNPVTDELASTVAVEYQGVHPAPWSLPKEAIIDGNHTTYFELLPDSPAAFADTQLTITVDLNGDYTLGKAIAEWLPGRRQFLDPRGIDRWDKLLTPKHRGHSGGVYDRSDRSPISPCGGYRSPFKFTGPNRDPGLHRREHGPADVGRWTRRDVWFRRDRDRRDPESVVLLLGQPNARPCLL